MKKKRVIYKLSIIIPLFLIHYVLTNLISFSIPGLCIFIEPFVADFPIIIFTVLWLCCSPFKHGCCDGTLTELFFNLVPVEAVLLLNLAQWNLVIFIATALILFATLEYLYIVISNEENRHPSSRRSRFLYRVAFRKVAVAFITAISLIPCSISLFLYGFSSPVYQAEQEDGEDAPPGDAGSPDPSVPKENAYEKNRDLWALFDETSWKKLSIEKKVTALQRLADFEAGIMGIKAVSVTSKLIGLYTLGSYEPETKQIFINTEYLKSQSVEECIETICHEVRHSLQHQVVDSIDWEDPVYQISYFDEIQSWRRNQENYKNAWVYGQDEYEVQPLEVDASKYAEKETEKILTYIKGTGAAAVEKPMSVS